MIVIDCSVLISSLLPDESDSLAEHVIDQLAANEIQALVPTHFYLECSNVLLMAYIKRELISNIGMIIKILFQICLLKLIILFCSLKI